MAWVATWRNSCMFCGQTWITDPDNSNFSIAAIAIERSGSVFTAARTNMFVSSRTVAGRLDICIDVLTRCVDYRTGTADSVEELLCCFFDDRL